MIFNFHSQNIQVARMQFLSFGVDVDRPSLRLSFHYGKSRGMVANKGL